MSDRLTSIIWSRGEDVHDKSFTNIRQQTNPSILTQTQEQQVDVGEETSFSVKHLTSCPDVLHLFLRRYLPLTASHFSHRPVRCSNTSVSHQTFVLCLYCSDLCDVTALNYTVFNYHLKFLNLPSECFHPSQVTSPRPWMKPFIWNEMKHWHLLIKMGQSHKTRKFNKVRKNTNTELEENKKLQKSSPNIQVRTETRAGSMLNVYGIKWTI